MVVSAASVMDVLHVAWFFRSLAILVCTRMSPAPGNGGAGRLVSWSGGERFVGAVVVLEVALERWRLREVLEQVWLPT